MRYYISNKAYEFFNWCNLHRAYLLKLLKLEWIYFYVASGT